MPNVILMNPFEVPPERVDDCLAYWEDAAAIMRRAPGFVSTALHQAIDPAARFALINRAEWESLTHFQAAVTSADFQALTARNKGRFQYYPGLYRVVRT